MVRESCSCRSPSKKGEEQLGEAQDSRSQSSKAVVGIRRCITRGRGNSSSRQRRHKAEFSRPNAYREVSEDPATSEPVGHRIGGWNGKASAAVC